MISSKILAIKEISRSSIIQQLPIKRLKFLKITHSIQDKDRNLPKNQTTEENKKMQMQRLEIKFVKDSFNKSQKRSNKDAKKLKNISKI